MKTALTHMDCRNFVAIDVAKGMCHRTKDTILADDEHCEHFTALPKCKFCDHFALTAEYLGTCNAASNKPMTYPDLVAVTCEMFRQTATKA
jgi:4-hydroxyphenylacetate decarboxylase small subunit